MRKTILLSLVVSTFLFGEDNLDNLLGEFTQNSDLSFETKIKNAGHTIVYTRSDIEKMQARNLRDIMKSIPFFILQETRAGIPNFNMLNEKIPFSSSQIRIYLDNHEITSGTYGSIFAYMGSIELEFVDHIELYLSMPSFEYSTESTQVLVKLHTKVPQRDAGGKATVSGGTHGYNQQSLYYAKELENFSYFTYLSRLDDKRDNPTSDGVEVSKDKYTEHFVGSLFNDKHHFLVNGMRIKQDLSANFSIDGTNTQNKSQYNHFQMSYQNSVMDNFHFKASYQRTDDKLLTADDKYFYCKPNLANPLVPICTNMIDLQLLDQVTTLQGDYYAKLGANDILAGATIRNKSLDYKHFITNNGVADELDYDNQNVYSIYLQDELSLNDNSIVVAGAKHSKIDNNADVKDQYLTMYRLGYTYNNSGFVSKLFYYRNPAPLEPYLYSSFFSQNKDLEAEVMNSFVGEINYTHDRHDWRVLVSKCTTENMLYYNEKYKLVAPAVYLASIDNFSQDVESRRMMVDYTFHYSPLHSLKVDYFRQHMQDTPFGDYKEMGGYIRLLDTFGKFDIFNEVIYREITLDSKDWYDYSAGIKYRVNEDLAFSFKGENILNKAMKQQYTRTSTINYIAFTNLAPLESTPVDKKYYFSMEYSF